MGKLSDAELARVREKFAKSAIGQSELAPSGEREMQVLAAPDRYRLHRREGQQLFRMTVTTRAELRQALLDLPSRLDVLVYAIRDYPDGERSALLPLPEIRALLQR